MSTHIPLRIARIQAQPLRRQCLFQRSRPAPAPRHFAASTSRPFSATATRLREPAFGYRLEDSALQKAAAEQHVNPAPSVHTAKAMRGAKGADSMAEDIGLLQHTVVRAPLSQLPPMHDWKFWGYIWTLLKSKGAALWTRSLYRQCLQKQRASRYLPVDMGNNKQLVLQAKKLYEKVHKEFATGQAESLRKHCLPPLAQHFASRMAAGKSVKTTWSLKKWKSARVVSHRASPMGEEHPDTCYRQVIVRLESVQHTTITPKSLNKVVVKGRKPAWTPEGAQEKTMFKENSTSERHIDETKTVVDYFVIQRRVMYGKQEDWKAWGFTTASTPTTLNADDDYWRKATEIQAANAT